MHAAIFAIATIAEEAVRLAAGTWWRTIDVVSAYSGAFELRAHRDPEIDVFFVGPLHDHPWHSAERGAKLLDDLWADLEALGSDRWAQRDPDVLRRRTELAHAQDHVRRDTVDGPAPAGVCRADHAGDRVGKQQRNAVGRERAEHRADLIGDEAVEFGGIRERLANAPDTRAMHVAHDLELLRIVASVRREEPAVLLDVRLVITPSLAKIQRCTQAAGDAAATLGKSVYESFAWDDVRRMELDLGARGHPNQLLARGIVGSMIPYDDLVAALSAWRARQGLPVNTIGGTSGSGPNRSGSGPNRTPPPAPLQAEPLEVSDELLDEAAYENEGNDFAVGFGATAEPEPTAIADAPERPTEMDMGNGGNDREDW